MVAAVAILTAGCGSRTAWDDLEPPAPQGNGRNERGGPRFGGAGMDLTGASPAELGDRLAIWLDGSFGPIQPGGEIVTNWVDRTANGNDGHASGDPVRMLVSGSKAVGQVIFDGKSYFTIADAPTLQWGNDDYVVEVVAAYTNAPARSFTGQACFYEKIGNGAEGVSLTGNGIREDNNTSPVIAAVSSAVALPDLGLTNITGDTLGVNDGTFHVFGTRRTMLHHLEVRLDGRVDGASDIIQPRDISAIGQPLYVGAIPHTPESLLDPVSGRIAEVIGVHGTVTDAELRRLEGYLRSKYGL
jgi:hypothetical protein